MNGFIYFIRGLGAIFGAPIAGVILGSHKRTASVNGGIDIGLGVLQKRYNDVVVYDGVLLIGAGLYVFILFLAVVSLFSHFARCVAYVRWLDARDKGKWAWKA